MDKEGIKTSLVCFEVRSYGPVSKDNVSRIRSMFSCQSRDKRLNLLINYHCSPV